jgi:hypothetical protein
MATGVGLEILLIIIAIIWLVIWILTLNHQSKRGRIWWLDITALIQLVLIIYWIVYLVSPKFKQKEKIAQK